MNQEKIGTFIAKCRKAKNMTQSELAEKLNISTNAVSKWERGLSFPDVQLFKPLCNELGISIEELINGEKNTSVDAKDKAIINIAKSKEKTKKKLHYLILLSIVIIILLVIIGILIYKNKQDELSKYYERNYQKTFVARNIEAIMKYRNNGEYPDYYGGMYISDDAYNTILLIVKDKVPNHTTREYYYYNELITLDESIKIEYVINSYNDLEKVYNTINDYLSNNTPPKDLNSVGIDVMKNRVVVNYIELTEDIIKNFKENIIDSPLVEFVSGIENLDITDTCINYPDNLGDNILTEHGNLLMSIHTGNKSYVPVSLSIYDDGTYELFTTYATCRPGAVCNSMLKYIKSVKGTYNYDIEKILKASTNADDKSYSMDNLPEYEIYLGEEYMKKYDSLEFTVEKGKKNKYLNEFLKLINVNLSKCAKPEYQ